MVKQGLLVDQSGPAPSLGWQRHQQRRFDQRIRRRKSTAIIQRGQLTPPKLLQQAAGLGPLLDIVASSIGRHSQLYRRSSGAVRITLRA